MVNALDGRFIRKLEPMSRESEQNPTQFKPGQSGNPAGKPKGTRNATTLALETLFDGQA